MEAFSLLLLGLGLVLAGAPESIMEILNKEFSGAEMQYDVANSDQEKQTSEVLMNLTLLYKNTSTSMSKDILFSLLLTSRLHYSFPRGNGPGNGKEYCNDVVVGKKVSEANGSCRLSNNFICGSMEVMPGVCEASSCKCGQNLGTSCSRNPHLETTMFQHTMDKQFPRCQYHSDTSLKKILAVLTGNFLMSWLVSGSNL
ncbi:probable ribonuclease 11 [Suricata suricatta]|uniref:probable ribonuclease 11 n=1 Tax=Suricata suricatta TaxID=37032 RepID=UPI001155807E|nr:probable ribonuclease 11 [Suricata suricatta]